MLPPINRLFCHPASPAGGVTGAAAAVSLSNDGVLQLQYRFDCAPGAIDAGKPAPPERTDGLWQHTCLEVFLRFDDPQDISEYGYAEFNFAPSGQWAAYHFTGYRAGMVPLAIAAPQISVSASSSHFALEASVMLPDIWRGRALQAAISAVIAENDGTKSYWALNHTGAVPDFHDQACFTLQLLPAETI